MYEFYDDMNDVFREPFAADGAVVTGAAVNGGSSGTGVTARLDGHVLLDVPLGRDLANPSWAPASVSMPVTPVAAAAAAAAAAVPAWPARQHGS